MKIDFIVNTLDQIIPSPKGELNYNKDYEFLIAVMLSAQTTDKRVNMVTKNLFDKYDDLLSLSEASISDIEQIIKSLGTFRKKAINVKTIAQKLLPYNKVINDRTFLESLPGVGRKTTNVVLAELYDVPCIAVDTHVARVSIRLGLARKNDSVNVIEQKLTKKLKKYNLNRLHHQILLFGRYHCKAINPECSNCKFINICKKKS